MFNPDIQLSTSFQVQQLDGELTKREQVEAHFASSLGKMVNLLNRYDSPILKKTSNVLTDFLEKRNEIVNQSNQMAAGRISSAPSDVQQHGMITGLLLKTVTSHFKRSEMPPPPSITPPSTPSTTQTRLQEEVWQNSEKLNHPGLTDKGREKLRNELQMDKAALKTNQTSEPHFQKIAQGKAKQVWRHTSDHQHAYFTPVKGTFDRLYNVREAEIKEELQTAKTIQSRLVNSQGTPITDSNLALEMEEVNGEARIDGQYTVRTKKADGDLEKQVNQGKITFPESLAIASQVLNGMSNLHEAGFIHGDIKLENVLIYQQSDGTLEARISDFGKTQSLEEGKTTIHAGNPRYAAPEGRQSQKGEVFGTAIMLIRILEGELLGSNDMLTQPKNQDNSVDASKRRGVEKFLVTNSECSQTETTTLKGKVKVYGRQLKLAVGLHSKENLQAQNEIHRYIGELVKGLSAKHPDEKSQEKINELGTLLRTMTQSDPMSRPSLQQVNEGLRQIL